MYSYRQRVCVSYYIQCKREVVYTYKRKGLGGGCLVCVSYAWECAPHHFSLMAKGMATTMAKTTTITRIAHIFRRTFV